MSAALITPAVKAVLSDLGRWHLLGVDIVVVQATPEDGVYVGVAGDPACAQEALAGWYPFPVACWHFE
jgi:hypothetical protein